ncbi:MAG: hypothetical protein IID44_19990 [Planctomycetes bacterium]|nr:hypothetical protein [Planctomycetota bacterium]
MAKNRKTPKYLIQTEEPKVRGAIQEPKLPPSDRVLWCFKYLETGHKTFRIDQLPKDFGNILLVRLQKYGAMAFREFIPNNSLNSHLADIERIEAHGGFRGAPEELWHERPWQFSIQNKMRAVGFLIGTVFHIVWIDINHKFDSSK